VRSTRSKRTSRAPSSLSRALKISSGNLVVGDSYLAKKSLVAFNARLHEETDRDALSEGPVGVASTMQRKHISLCVPSHRQVSRAIVKVGADGLATTYSPECVEGEFSEVPCSKPHPTFACIASVE
jgi:hypothetical protein